MKIKLINSSCLSGTAVRLGDSEQMNDTVVVGVKTVLLSNACRYALPFNLSLEAADNPVGTNLWPPLNYFPAV